MPEKAAPRKARIIVPVDGVTAARLQSDGLSIEYLRNRVYAKVTLELDPTDPLVAAASDNVDAKILGNEIVLDLGVGPRALVDETPPIPPQVPGPSRSPLWPKPQVVHGYCSAVHLRADESAVDLPQAVLAWLLDAPHVDDDTVQKALVAWRTQAARMLQHATETVEHLRDRVVSEEWHGLVNRLDRLAFQVRHARDGGSDPEDPDFEEDPFGDRFLKPAHWYVNEAFEEVLDACGRTSAAGSDRTRGEHAQAELLSMASFLSDTLPERYRKARKLEMLPTLLGAARRELLGVVWPTWDYSAEDEVLRPVANPSIDALDSLANERAFDAEERPWQHDRIALMWRVSAKTPVLVSSFLGRTILREIETSEGEL